MAPKFRPGTRMAKSQAPCRERKPPDIFCRSLAIRRSVGPLFVNGMRGSVRKEASLLAGGRARMPDRPSRLRRSRRGNGAVKGEGHRGQWAKRAALWARPSRRCMLLAQSSFSISRLEFAQVMSVAGAVAHALESEVAGVIVMDEDALEVLVDIAASGADAQDGQQWGAEHVEFLAMRMPASRCLTGAAVRIVSATRGMPRSAVRFAAWPRRGCGELHC